MLHPILADLFSLIHCVLPMHLEHHAGMSGRFAATCAPQDWVYVNTLRWKEKE